MVIDWNIVRARNYGFTGCMPVLFRQTTLFCATHLSILRFLYCCCLYLTISCGSVWTSVRESHTQHASWTHPKQDYARHILGRLQRWVFVGLLEFIRNYSVSHLLIVPGVLMTPGYVVSCWPNSVWKLQSLIAFICCPLRFFLWFLPYDTEIQSEIRSFILTGIRRW